MLHTNTKSIVLGVIHFREKFKNRSLQLLKCEINVCIHTVSKILATTAVATDATCFINASCYYYYYKYWLLNCIKLN